MKKAVLHLNLRAKWYKMIASGRKEEEYREVKPYWERVFVPGKGVKIKGRFYRPQEVAVCFSNGYLKGRQQMTISLLDVAVRTGNPEWGAKPGQKYFVLVLGTETDKEELI